MKILGIDYGTKRVGIGISDHSGRFALPHSVIANSSRTNFESLASEIKKIADQNEVQEIVLGESKNYQGQANAILADSLELKGKLEDLGYRVHLEPEFMTSAAAERFQGKNELVDASAAALILQSYLDRVQSRNDQS